MQTEIITALQDMIGQELRPHSASGFGRWLGGKLIAIEYGSLSISYEVQPEMCNPTNKLHGGVSAAMIDEVMGMLLYCMQLPVLYVTVSLNTDYFYSAKQGETVIVTGKVCKQGKSIINLEGTITNEAGKVLVKASSNYAATSTQLN